MQCRICKSDCVPVLKLQGIWKCPVCETLNKQDIPDPKYYPDISYWYTDPWLKLYQKSIFVYFEQDILDLPSLEIGAADGDMLHLVQQLHPKQETIYCELVDLHRKEYQFTEYWIDQVEKFYGNIKYLPQPHNILLINLVEHLVDPLKILEVCPSGSRLFIVTDDGDAFLAHDALLLHVEHSCVITKKGFELAAKNNKAQILRYYPTPVNISVTVIDKL